MNKQSRNKNLSSGASGLGKLFTPLMRKGYLIIFSTNLLVYYGNKLYQRLSNCKLTDISTSLDSKIPTIPGFTPIYALAFPFWFGSLYLIFSQGEKHTRRMIYTNTAALIFCGIIFAVFPTTAARETIEAKDLCSLLLNFIYSCDTPTNLFPSIHCMESFLVFEGVKSIKNIPAYIKILVGIFAVLVCMSTLFTKQHVIPDVLAGIVAAELFWLIGKRFIKCED